MDQVVAHWVDRMLSSTLELKQMQTDSALEQVALAAGSH